MGLGAIFSTKGYTQFVNTTFDGLANNATTFPDAAGTLNGCAWTAVSGAKATTTSPLTGTSSLSIPNCTTDAISAPYTLANGIPRSGSWKLFIKIQSGGSWNTGGGGKTLLSVQDASATAAGTVFGIATNASGALALIYSDGSTRSVTSGGPSVNTTGTFDVEVYRDAPSGTLKWRVNGGSYSSVNLAFSFVFNGV